MHMTVDYLLLPPRSLLPRVERMGNDTQSGRKIIGDSSSSRKRFINGKGSSNSGSGTSGNPGLRRSARATSSRKQMTSSASNTRKLELLEKRTPKTPLAKKKSERVEKQKIPSPLRRSDRCKKRTSSSSLGSMKSEWWSGSADMKQTEKRKKCVKQLIMEAREGIRGENHDSNRKRKRMDGRTFKAMHKEQQIRDAAPDFELEGANKLSQADSSNARVSGSNQVDDREYGLNVCSGGKEEESRGENVEEKSQDVLERCNSSLRNFNAGPLENHVEIKFLSRDQSHSCKEEHYKPSIGDGIKASNSGDTVEENVDDDEKLLPDCTVIDTSATVISKDIRTSNGDAASLSSSACRRHKLTETCVTCSKRRRLGRDSSEQELCSCNTTSYKDSHDTGIPESWKESSVKLSKLQGNSGDAANSGSRSLPRSTACVTETLHTHASELLFSSDNSLSLGVHMAESEERTFSATQKRLHLLLKPQILELCEILKLSEDDKHIVGRFLGYIIKNHHVSREPATILQAFQISLCWTVASLLDHKIDKKESLALAKQHLNFSCKEEEADYVYLKLRSLKKMFLSSPEIIKELGSLKDSTSAAEYITKKPLDARVRRSLEFKLQNVIVEVKERSKNQEFADEQQVQAPKYKMDKKGLRIANIHRKICTRRDQEKCKKWMAKLRLKQEEEIQEFNRIWDEKRVQLEKEHRTESASYSHILVGMDKNKILDNEFAKKMEKHECQKDMCLKELEANQLAARTEVRQRIANWFAEAKSGAHKDVSSDELCLHESESRSKLGYSQASEHRPQSGPEDVVPVSNRYIEDKNPDGIVHNMQRSQVAPAAIPKCLLNKSLGASAPAESKSLSFSRNSENDGVDTIPLERVSVGAVEQPNIEGSCYDSSEDIVSANLPSEVKIHNGVLPSGQTEEVQSEAPEIVPNEPVEKGIHAVFDGENDRVNAISTDITKAAGNQNNRADYSINGDSSSMELSLVKLHSIQPVDSPACDGLLPQNLDKCSPSLTYTEIQDEGEPFRGKQSTLELAEVQCLQPVDAGPTDQSTHKAPLSEPLKQLNLSLSTDLRADLAAASGIVQQPHSEEDTSSHDAEASLLLPENTAELSDGAVWQTGANFELHPPNDATESPLMHNQSDLRSSCRVEHQPSGVLHPSFQSSETMLPNQAVLQPGANLSIVQGSNNLAIQTIHQEAFQMRTTPLHIDPLKNELERICKEIEQTTKVHEDTKLRLQSVCEKEIEEITAQIRSKYEAKLQDAEAVFLLQKSELDMNQNTVLMNKILAEAFRFKCLDLRPSRARGVQQGFMQQLHQLPLQRTPRPPVTGLYSASQPAASQQNTMLRQQVVQSITPRPPHICPITPSTGNLRVVGEIRAPAPHIQPFRASASMSAANPTSLRRGMSNQQAPSSLPATSPSFPPLPPRPPLPTNRSVHYSRPSKSENVGGLPASRNSSLSAVELLVDIDNQSSTRQPNSLLHLPDFSSNFDSVALSKFGTPGTRQPNSLPHLPDFGSKFDSVDLSKFGTSGSEGGRSDGSAVANDIVCLSDDE